MPEVITAPLHHRLQLGVSVGAQLESSRPTLPFVIPGIKIERPAVGKRYGERRVSKVLR